jgi:hypothetical protein
MLLSSTDPAPFLAVETPVAAVEYLKADPEPHMFHEMGYGSYFIWAIPEQGVFVDPRIELYDYEQWLDYLRISRGVRYNKLLMEYGVERIVLDVELQEELKISLEDDTGWRRVYADERTQIWDRISNE